MIDEILETWRINNRVNLLLLENIGDEGMQCTLSQRGGRNVVRQFAHLHNNRVWHLKERAKALAKGARLFETKEEPDRRALIAALRDSANRVERMFSRAHDGGTGVRPFKRGVIAYLGYFIAHESHHRGNILLTLKQCGHRLDKKVQYAIWDWGRI
jgi:uncharacterized damage-inducible protein DinB